MAVVAAAGLIVSASKLPPLALLIVADTLPASTYASSPGAATLTVPELAPAATVIVAPLERLTVTAGLRRVGQRRGVDDAAAFGHARRGGEADRGAVDRVGDGGRCGGGVDGERLESCRRSHC